MLNKFISYLEKQVKNGAIYVWGGQGEIASQAKIRTMETSERNVERALKLYKERLKTFKSVRMFDCSGLVCKALEECGVKKKGFDTTANGLYKDHCKRIKKIDLRKGDLVFRVENGNAYHIGVVVSNDLDVIEAYGRDKGVIERDIDASKGYWNAYGRLKVFEEDIKAQFVVKRVLKRTIPNMKGDDVKAVQRALNRKGYSISVDGAYGKNTKSVVEKFQKNSKITVDGKVGKNTVEKLGGEWKG